MRRFARRLKPLRLRREARARHGRRLDLPTTIRRSVASGGTPFHLAWQEPPPRAAAAGAADRRQPLDGGLQLLLPAPGARARRASCRTCTASSSTPASRRCRSALHDPDPWRAQEQLHLLAQGWAGGTRIGESLAQFNREHAPRAGAFAHRRPRAERRLRHRRSGAAVGGAGAAAPPRAPHRLAQPAGAPAGLRARSARACRPRCRTWTCWRPAPTWPASRAVLPQLIERAATEESRHGLHPQGQQRPVQPHDGGRGAARGRRRLAPGRAPEGAARTGRRAADPAPADRAVGRRRRRGGRRARPPRRRGRGGGARRSRSRWCATRSPTTARPRRCASACRRCRPSSTR